MKSTILLFALFSFYTSTNNIYSQDACPEIQYINVIQECKNGQTDVVLQVAFIGAGYGDVDYEWSFGTTGNWTSLPAIFDQPYSGPFNTDITLTIEFPSSPLCNGGGTDQFTFHLGEDEKRCCPFIEDIQVIQEECDESNFQNEFTITPSIYNYTKYLQYIPL